MLIRGAAAEQILFCSSSTIHVRLFVFLCSTFCSEMISVDSPVSINEAGVDVVGALHPSDWLQADTGGLERHDVHQAVLEFVTQQVGTDES